MPGYDGTGPEGTGPIGRGLGPCGGGNVPGRGGGLGFQRGWRRGPRGFWRSGMFRADQQTLTHEKAWLERELDAVKSQLDTLGNETNKE
ncbi:MAG TPA: hypothetical protein DF984_04205 [Anaerolineaceae bacterium]|nr:hypothetical protein [Anaerolineaceae bacterium]